MAFKIGDWFYMRGDRSSFQPTLPKDAGLLFCHRDITEQAIRINVEKSFAKNKPIKMLIHGDWGVGKTHSLHNLEWWLREQETEYPTKTVRIEIGDITKKSHFDRIVSPLLDVMGLDYLVALVNEFRTIETNINDALMAIGAGANVAKALAMFQMAVPNQAPTQQVVLAFEYLKGIDLGAKGPSVGLMSPIKESADFYNVLKAVGHIYFRVHSHRIVFIADEAARLEMVDHDEAVQAHWVNAHKLIFDPDSTDFGFIYTISGRRNQLPPALWEPQVQNRIGENNVVELQSLEKHSVEEFLSSLFQEFIDMDRVKAAVAGGEILEEDFDEERYPFTSAAWAEFLDFFDRNQEDAKPRDITDRLDDVAFMAAKAGDRVINESALRKANM
ncbi:hypothetical protein ACFL5A_02615 [Gemmatimonadota bacterium]